MPNLADVALLSVIALSCMAGIWRGFVVEMMSLVVWVLAFWLAFRFGNAAAAALATAIDSPPVRLLIGYASLFVAALCLGALATWLVGRLVKRSGLSGTDRLLGLGFGLARGGALCCVLVLLLGFTTLPQDPWWRESRLLPSFVPGALWLRTWLPDTVSKYVRFDALPTGLTLPTPPPIP